jgi:hypothetical protein
VGVVDAGELKVVGLKAVGLKAFGAVKAAEHPERSVRRTSRVRLVMIMWWWW